MDSITSRLSLPARKMLCENLTTAIPANNDTAIPGLHMWQLQTAADRASGQRSATFSIVWVQGRITSLTCDGQAFMLHDGTAQMKIMKGTSAPTGVHTVEEEGGYMMVIGEMLDAGETPIIQAMKIQDLSEDSLAETAWHSEVKDQDKYI